MVKKLDLIETAKHALVSLAKPSKEMLQQRISEFSNYHKFILTSSLEWMIG